MWNRITEFLKSLSVYIGIFFVLYFLIATWTFAIRHPWATDIERLVHVGDALIFKKTTFSIHFGPKLGDASTKHFKVDSWVPATK